MNAIDIAHQLGCNQTLFHDSDLLVCQNEKFVYRIPTSSYGETQNLRMVNQHGWVFENVKNKIIKIKSNGS